MEQSTTSKSESTGGGVWRRSAPSATVAAGAGSTPPDSPAPSAPTGGKYVPGAFRRGGAAGGGWREREAARATGGGAGSGTNTPVRPASPAVVETPKANDDDGFQTVTSNKQGAWRPRGKWSAARGA